MAHQMGLSLSPALDAAMRAQFENQAAFHAAAGGAPPQPPPGFGAPLMAPPPGLPGALPGMPPVDLSKLAPPQGSTFQALFGQGLPPGGTLPPVGLLQPPPAFPALDLSAPPAAPSLLAQPPPQQPAPGPPPQQNPQQMEQVQKAIQKQAEAEAARAAAVQNAANNKAKREQQIREQAAKAEQAAKKKCHLHSKPKKNCKFCQRYEDFVKGQDDGKKEGGVKKGPGGRGDDLLDRRGPLEIVNSKTFGFSPLLQTHIVESAHYKALITLEGFDQLVDEMYQFADNIEPYMTNSSTTPSALFCCLYRLFTISIDARQLRRLIDNTDNPYVRCTGFLFIRFGLPPEQLWPWLGEYVCDDEELRPAKDSEWWTTVGEFVEGLLSQDKYYSTVLPRLPMSTKRQLEAKLAPIAQYRKRTKANLELLDIYRLENVKVEANSSGDWLVGQTVELIDDAPSRLKVRVRLEDSTEEIVHLGKVILTDKRYAGYSGTRDKRARSRSRSRTDWARQKGRTDKELVDELRSKDREKAVCTSGKEYARKPLGYKAACALPREQGTASTRLMEEETFVPMKQGRRRSPSPSQREQEFRKAPSAEHQARMQALFEKYGMSGGAQQAAGKTDIDTPDVMRLG